MQVELVMASWIHLRGLARRAFMQVGSVKKSRDAAKRNRSDFYELIWKEAAEIQGASCEKLGDDFLLISKDQRRALVNLNYTPLDDPVTLRLAGQKPIVTELLSKSQIPVPSQLSFGMNSFEQANDFLQKNGECVVKPAGGTGGGQGVTTGVQTHSQLKQAIITAAGFGQKIVIEKQIPGENFRLLFLDGELIDAVQRNSPSVIGDGVHSIRQLIKTENQERVKLGHRYAQTVLTIDSDMRNSLNKQGYSLSSKPASEKRVIVKTAINDNTADDNISVLGEICPEIIDVARKSAQVIGLRLAGVDIITRDLTRGLDETGGVVLEVNSTPGLFIHYSKRDGASNVAVPILKTCLENSCSPWKFDATIKTGDDLTQLNSVEHS